MAGRHIVPVTTLECLQHCAQQNQIALPHEVATLLIPIFTAFRQSTWIQDNQVITFLNAQVQGKTPAWTNEFLAGSANVAQFLAAPTAALLARPNAATLIHVDAEGTTTYSPDGLGHLFLQLGGQLGQDLQMLLSNPGALAAIHASEDYLRQRRQGIRNDNADLFNANRSEIVSRNLADEMFTAREETSFYRATVTSTDAALAQVGYEPAERKRLRRGSLRTAQTVALGANTRQRQIIQGILLQNTRPNAPLSHLTPEQFRARFSQIQSLSAQSYNSVRPTIHKRRQDAFVPRT